MSKIPYDVLVGSALGIITGGVFLYFGKSIISLILIGISVFIIIWSVFIRNNKQNSIVENQSEEFSKPKNGPVDRISIIKYCRTSKRLLSIAHKIATLRSLEVVDIDNESAWLIEKLDYFKIDTIVALDKLIQKYEKQALALSTQMTNENDQYPNSINTAHVIQLVLWIYVIEIGGLESLKDFHRSLKMSTGGGSGFCEEIFNAYKNIKEYGA